MRVEYEGREWSFPTPGPSLAMDIKRMGELEKEDLAQEIIGMVIDHIAVDDWVELSTRWRAGDLPEDAPVELFMLWLEQATGKPMSAVVTLSALMVRNWPVIRGRLVTSGVPDPLRQIPTLAGILDATEFMVRESHQDDKERARYQREVYRPRASKRKVQRPAGFDSSAMDQQAKMLEGLG